MHLQGCSVNCEHGNGGQAPCYHVKCRGFAPWPSQALLRAAEYSYEPTVAEDQRRVSRIQLLLGRRLQAVYGQLPTEICLMIAGELVREFAAMATGELWGNLPGGEEPGCSLIPITRNVRAQYIYLDGVRYVKSLSIRAQGDLILNSTTSSVIDTIHVLEDHLGIRQIVFSTPERSRELSSLLSTPVRDAWWRNIPFSSDIFLTVSDVSDLVTCGCPRSKACVGRQTEKHRSGWQGAPLRPLSSHGGRIPIGLQRSGMVQAHVPGT